MRNTFDELLDVFAEYADARARGDAVRAEELKGPLRSAFGAAVAETVAEDLRANGPLTRWLVGVDGDSDVSLTFHLPEREIREGRTEPA